MVLRQVLVTERRESKRKKMAGMTRRATSAAATSSSSSSSSSSMLKRSTMYTRRRWRGAAAAAVVPHASCTVNCEYGGARQQNDNARKRKRRRSWYAKTRERDVVVHAAAMRVKRGVSALYDASVSWLDKTENAREERGRGRLLESMLPNAVNSSGNAARRRAGNEKLDPLLLELTKEYTREKLDAYFANKPMLVASRLAQFASSLARVVASRRSESPERWRQIVREEVSRLGPVVVKCGQTLSQREDLVAQDLADELKTLQDDNTPFSTSVAFDTIRRELGHDGPIAARIIDDAVENVLINGGSDNDALPTGSGGGEYTSSSSSSLPRPLFKSITSKPVASASLGQVYRATLWPEAEGLPAREVAVKVQRPGLLASVAKDVYVLQLFLALLRSFWDLGGGSGPDLTFIADNVGEGVFRELDYRTEAANCVEFGERHAFLGFVRTPEIITELTTRRVLVMEWVVGEKLGQIQEASRRKLFVDKAIEAAAAQLLQTGMVHADPHEGNLLLDAENKLVFLDFGLVSYVESRHQEAFSSGIVHLLTGNWRALASDFIEMDFVPENFMCVAAPDEDAEDQSSQRWVSCSREQFCDAIEEKMASYVRGYRESQADIATPPPPVAREGGGAGGVDRTAGETSQSQSQSDAAISGDNVAPPEPEGKGFGDLVAIFGGLSNEYRFLCPPYSILLGRSYATLEGIAAKVDPRFNVYEACVPFAIRRGLAPKTELYTESLRASFLDAQGAFKWKNLMESLELATSSAESATEVHVEGDGADAAAAAAADGGEDLDAPAAVRQSTVTETEPTMAANSYTNGYGDSMTVIAGVLGATEGKVLRRILWDASSASMFEPLARPGTSAELRLAVRSAVESFVAVTAARIGRAFAALIRMNGNSVVDGEFSVDVAVDRGAAAARETRWTNTVSRLLLRHHLSNLISAKTAPHQSVLVLASSCITLVSLVFMSILKMSVRATASRLTSRRRSPHSPPPSLAYQS